MVCVAGRLASTLFRRVMDACILRSGTSASACTAIPEGCPCGAGIVDQTVDPRLTIGFCVLSAEAISIAARAAPGKAGSALLSCGGAGDEEASPGLGAGGA